MTNSINCIYLHGFASGPRSEKATFFAERLHSIGCTVHIPDLNEPAFADLTFTRMLKQVETLAAKLDADAPIVLLGSSMGGLLATMLAQRIEGIRALVLFAPGFAINQRWQVMPGKEVLAKWQQEGTHAVPHHAHDGALCPLKYSFVEDANRYETVDLRVQVPTLVFHGMNDEVVPVDLSRAFTKANPEYCQYHEMESDHGLLDVMEEMWAKTDRFLRCCELKSLQLR